MTTVYIEDSEYAANEPYGDNTLLFVLFMILSCAAIAILYTPKIIFEKLKRL